MLRSLSLLVLGFALLLPNLASAQVIIIDQTSRRIFLPPNPPRLPIPRPQPPEANFKVTRVDIQSDVRDQIAKVQVSQVFKNVSSQTIQTQIMFPLPTDAAISELTLLVDGKEFTGRLMKKEEARATYEAIVRQRKDPALLEYMGQGLFQTSVFPIPPNAERTVEIRYQQLLKKDNGLVDLLFPIGTNKHTSKAVDNLNVTVRVNATDQIRTVYSPSHEISIDRPNDKTAVCKLALKNVQAPDDFRLMYGTQNGLVGMNVISYRPSDSEDGYFLLLASPELKRDDSKTVSKSVIFVLDRSGSMNGEKIEQARAALKYFLNRLQKSDTFNIVAYDSAVESFRPELQRADEKTVQEALGFADGLFAGGSTNIDAALQTSLAMLTAKSHPSYVLFLTDGLPTVGTRDERQIASSAKQANQVGARLFNFGVGFDVNSRLLDRLSHDHRGQSVYVRPNEDIETHVAGLYNRIGSPLLTDIGMAIEFDREQAASEPKPIARMYPQQLTDLFYGEQFVVVGRYRKGGAAKVTLTGHYAGEQKKFTFGADFVDRSADESNGFVEKLWAVRRVGEIIDELDLRGQNQELVTELVALSIKHGILTPYTSFLADENVSLRDRENLARASRESRIQLSAESGQDAFGQRALKGGFQRAAGLEDLKKLQNSVANEAKPASSAGSPAGPGGRGGAAGRPGEKADKQIARRRVVDYADLLKEKAAAEAEGDDSFEDSLDSTVVQIGQKTFFRKDKIWKDSSVKEEEETKATRIVQFSKEYFDLAASHGGKLAKYFVFDEAVVINLEGKTYRVVPEEPQK
ncbi:MAG: VIT domain-containing protein [Planctomycetota bacterium]|nr:VIT domain-containing protein [Planctomycetota bacterium]MDA1248331.1 VIT domain-containing protein [Planctomycetota bacterium]